MGLKRWWKSHTKMSVSVGNASFTAEGEQAFVHQALQTFLAHAAPQSNAPDQQTQAPTHQALPIEAEDTHPSGPPTQMEPPANTDRTHIVRRRSRPRRRGFVRLHAIDGNISKVYAANERAILHSLLGKRLDLRKIGNVYCEDAALARRFKQAEHGTLWHALIHKQDR